MDSWQKELAGFLKGRGASLVGFACLKDIGAAAEAGYPSGISIGVSLNPEIVSQLTSGPTVPYNDEYNRVNQLLDALDEEAAAWLVDRGHGAKPLVRSEAPVDWEKLCTAIPHKSVAIRGGLGWIGRSALVVTPEYGPAVRFSTVLTDAAVASQPITADGCGTCNRCREACPAAAIKGVPWAMELQRDSYYSAPDCRTFASGKCRALGFENDICGICINVCPYTQKYMRKCGVIS